MTFRIILTNNKINKKVTMDKKDLQVISIEIFYHL